MNQDYKYILFYSTNCFHSDEFLKLLGFSKQIGNQLVKINILNTNQTIPTSLKVVPTLYIRKDFTKYEGEKAFKWLQQTILAEQKQKTMGNSSQLTNSNTLSQQNRPLQYNPNITDNDSYFNKIQPMQQQMQPRQQLQPRQSLQMA